MTETSSRAVPPPTIIFDYDDTVGGIQFPDGSVHPGAAAYDDIIRREKEFVTTLGYDGLRFLQLQHDIDLVLAKQHGFGDKTRFAQSFVEAFKALREEAGHTLPLPNTEKSIFTLGMKVFTDYPYVALEGALDVLDKLSQFYRIAIVTKGEYEEQMKKLRDSGCGAYADQIFVVGKKNEDEWNTVLDELGFHTPEDAVESWAVGNSAKADVNPLLPRGFHGIEIAEKNKWTFEQAALGTAMEGRVATTISDITEVLSIIPSPYLPQDYITLDPQ